MFAAKVSSMAYGLGWLHPSLPPAIKEKRTVIKQSVHISIMQHLVEGRRTFARRRADPM
jgi:hypothetical protein